MELFLRSQLKTKRINGCTWTMVTLSFFQISFWMMLHTCFKKSQSWRNSCVRTYTWCSHIESKVFFFSFFFLKINGNLDRLKKFHSICWCISGSWPLLITNVYIFSHFYWDLSFLPEILLFSFLNFHADSFFIIFFPGQRSLLELFLLFCLFLVCNS